ncbi:Rv3235 family protein [Gordonia sp. ABSL49_1]|uniref:Rv3235 family protein n=1 Tax=unclassified Gordonia (in: high G+C Gram-positive bacteria) TaxID=2657482 RepID=UPI001F0DDE5D|nr:Rv3235 family protein [Gordonia sp. ABSL49_1]MCH5642247.1 Rv3235 family protein [Gordonia sp. ABSL49_1]
METRIRIQPAPPYEHTGAMVGVVDAPVRRPKPARPKPAAPARSAMVTATREARQFAILSARMIFEVIDRRRGIAQLGGMVSPAIVEQVSVLLRHNVLRSSDPTVGTALQRVHVQLRDTSTAEVFGSFAVGGRVRAFAGRAQRLPCRLRSNGPAQPGRLGKVEYRWQLVEFTLA